MTPGIGVETHAVPHVYLPKNTSEPFFHLCEQCKTRVESRIFKSEELEGTTPKGQLRSAFHYTCCKLEN
jgi:hypothetical protein